MAKAASTAADPHLEAARRRSRAFRAARRHTLVVRASRWLLPVGVVAAMGAYAFALFGTWSLRIGPGTIQASAIRVGADDLKMTGVRYNGIGKDGSRYDVRAREAAVDFAQTGPVKLLGIDGDLVQPTGVVTRLKAVRGAIDNKTGEMDLRDGVEVDATNGLKARMPSAKVWSKENRLAATEGVVAELPSGRIQAGAMAFETKARVGAFSNGVTVRLTQDAAQPRASVGLGKDARAPVDVTAPRLDVDDTARTAVFSGGTRAVQGESTLQASNLRITYEGSAAPAGSPLPAIDPSNPSAGAGSRVKTLAADGQVAIVSGPDQRIAADSVVFDVPGDTALFSGAAVEVQQGRNRLLGRRLSVDRKAGRSRLDSPADGRMPAGRIQTVFFQNEVKAAAPAAPRPKSEPDAAGALFATSFKADPNAPTDIAADSLDINDTTKQAIWRGKVRAQQGDVLIETPEMAATYVGETGLMQAPEGSAATPRTSGNRGGAQISKIDARGGVVVTSKDGQQVTGQNATFDMKSNSVLVTGGARAVMDRNSTAGEAIRMDLTTGMVEVITSFAARVSASTPAAAPKSASGPGGLPAIPGIQAIAPAIANTSGTQNCPPGRTCLEFYPEQAKKALANRKSESATPAGAAPVTTPADAQTPRVRPPRPPRPPTDGWDPQSDASPIYRN
jgi:lipopolysaccharide export system protein LptA